MKKRDIQQSHRQAVILTAVFFIIFCGKGFAEDVFEAKDPDETKTPDRLKIAGETSQPEPPPRPGVEKQPESPAPAETGKPLTADDVQKAFEKAIKAVDAGKLEDEKILEELLQKRFQIAAEGWINAASVKRAPDLNKLMDQKWEKLFEFGPFIHYDYYLRDYEFLEKGSDIIKTDSVTVPYRAYLNAAEKLYVEKYHTPDISYIEVFLYTATYPIKVNMEYRGDEFIVVNDEYGQAIIEKGWPAHVRSKLRDKVLAR
ncbi:MAG: hypothetical protein NTW09_03655 [Candidatus Omnitrophica bacterium]|nr:hypothetical protein [Candidatus Omnitrophota bacterium]